MPQSFLLLCHNIHLVCSTWWSGSHLSDAHPADTWRKINQKNNNNRGRATSSRRKIAERDQDHPSINWIRPPSPDFRPCSWSLRYVGVKVSKFGERTSAAAVVRPANSLMTMCLLVRSTASRLHRSWSSGMIGSCGTRDPSGVDVRDGQRNNPRVTQLVQCQRFRSTSRTKQKKYQGKKQQFAWAIGVFSAELHSSAV